MMSMTKVRAFFVEHILNKTVGRYYRIREELLEKHVLKPKKPQIWPILVERSLVDTAEFIEQNMLNTATCCFSRLEIIELAIANLEYTDPSNVRVYEFGVWEGKSIKIFAQKLPEGAIFGFDSFRGLPVSWTGTHTRAGYFDLGGKIPNSISGVNLVEGLFSESFPNFYHNFPLERDHRIDLLHMDADIYESTKEALIFFAARIRSGSLILFDEFFGYPNWRQHEFRAFNEFCNENRIKFEYIAFTTRQVLLRIL